MRKETIAALARVVSAPPEAQMSVIVSGFDQFGNEITETLMVPVDGSAATTKNVFYGNAAKASNEKSEQPSPAFGEGLLD